MTLTLLLNTFPGVDHRSTPGNLIVSDIQIHIQVSPPQHAPRCGTLIQVPLCVVLCDGEAYDLPEPFLLHSLIAACAAARRAIGTRNGLQDT